MRLWQSFAYSYLTKGWAKALLATNSPATKPAVERSKLRISLGSGAGTNWNSTNELAPQATAAAAESVLPSFIKSAANVGTKRQLTDSS